MRVGRVCVCVCVCVSGSVPIDGSPLGLGLEESLGLNVVVRVQREAMVDARGLIQEYGARWVRASGLACLRKPENMLMQTATAYQNEEITGLNLDADPTVILGADVKIARASGHIADLFVLVKMFGEKGFELILVIGQLFAGAGDLHGPRCLDGTPSQSWAG